MAVRCSLRWLAVSWASISTPKACGLLTRTTHATIFHSRLARRLRIPLTNAAVDVVISFETIEHFAEHDAFLREIKRVLKPDGVLLMSSPDRDVYSKGEPTQNPFHVKELDKTEFHSLIKTYFAHAAFGCQKAAAGSLILPETDSRMDIVIPVQVFDRGSSAHLEQSVGVQKAVYLLAVASDGALPVIRWGAYQDVTYVRRLLNELDAKNAEANQFGTELEERVAETARLSDQLSDAISAAREQQAARTAEAAETARLSDQLSDAISAAREQQAARTAEVNALRHQLEQAHKGLAAARRSLAEIKRSFSWRATRPLRGIVTQAQKLKPKKRRARETGFRRGVVSRAIPRHRGRRHRSASTLSRPWPVRGPVRHCSANRLRGARARVRPGQGDRGRRLARGIADRRAAPGPEHPRRPAHEIQRGCDPAGRRQHGRQLQAHRDGDGRADQCKIPTDTRRASAGAPGLRDLPPALRDREQHRVARGFDPIRPSRRGDGSSRPRIRRLHPAAR